MTSTDPDLHVCPACGSIDQCDRDIKAEVATDLLAQIEKAVLEIPRATEYGGGFLRDVKVSDFRTAVLAAIRSAAPVEPTFDALAAPEPSEDQVRRDAITADQRWSQGYAAGRAAGLRQAEHSAELPGSSR